MLTRARARSTRASGDERLSCEVVDKESKGMRERDGVYHREVRRLLCTSSWVRSNESFDSEWKGDFRKAQVCIRDRSECHRPEFFQESACPYFRHLARFPSVLSRVPMIVFSLIDSMNTKKRVNAERITVRTTFAFSAVASVGLLVRFCTHLERRAMFSRRLPGENNDKERWYSRRIISVLILGQIYFITPPLTRF